jgi:hypothetical protein
MRNEFNGTLETKTLLADNYIFFIALLVKNFNTAQ